MRKLLLTLSICSICINAYASQISLPKTYATNDTVTASNLNGNNNAIVQVVNGSLDNTNADTGNGYRYIEVKGALPSAGTQGRVIYLTTDDTLNFDTSSVYAKVITQTGTPANGDVIYYNSGWKDLAKGTASQVLTMNSGATIPEWREPLPVGGIIMWSGTIASIPTDWELSDGTCTITCPDLTNKFIVGADADDGGVAKSTITGSAAQSGGDTTHDHGAATGATAGSTFSPAGGASPYAASHTHTVSSDSHIPTFYALAYIIKVQ